MSNKTALITGAYRGLGLEVARQLLNQGYTVILTARKAGAGEKAADALAAETKGQTHFVALDVKNDESIATAAKEVQAIAGHLDVLINNAAIFPDPSKAVLDTPRAMLTDAFETNTLSPLMVTRAFIPLLKLATPGPGRVINVSSGLGSLSDMQNSTTAYSISKTALNAVTRQLAGALADDKILVNSVCPGWCRTEMGGSNAPRSPEEGAAGIVWLPRKLLSRPPENFGAIAKKSHGKSVVSMWMSLRAAFKSVAVSGYRGPANDHFNGERFINATPLKHKPLWTVLKWRLLSRTRHRWPAWVSAPPSAQKIVDISPEDLRWTFINHASWLIQIDGLNILTDPIWSANAGPTSWLGPKRVRLPGIRVDDLPRIDAVLISHNHYDHLDVPTLEHLEARDHPLFIVGLGNAAFLQQFGIGKVQEVDWWQSVHIGQTAFHFVPARHWSRRGWDDTNKTLWGGFVLQGIHQTVFFAGDTGYGPHFKEIRDRFSKIDIALLPIGAYEPRWFMKEAHMNPAEAVQAHLDLGAERSFGMHFGTFQLSDEPIDQPMLDLAIALDKNLLPPEAFIAPEFGKTYSHSGIRSGVRAS